METNYKKMPALFLSREAIRTLERFLTMEEAFKSILAVADYIWDGVEPDNLSEKVKGGYDTIMEYTRPKAEEWLKDNNRRIENAKKTNEIKAAKKAAQQKQQEIMANTNFDNEAPAQPINTAAQPIYRPIEAPQISIDSLAQPNVSATVNQPNNGYERHSNFVGYISDNMPAAYKNTTPTITMNEHGFPVYYMPVFEAHKKDFNHCVEVYGDKSSYEAQIGVLMRNYNLDTTYKSQFAQYLKGLAA